VWAVDRLVYTSPPQFVESSRAVVNNRGPETIALSSGALRIWTDAIVFSICSVHTQPTEKLSREDARPGFGCLRLSSQETSAQHALGASRL
jgi:hypothetical protein